MQHRRLSQLPQIELDHRLVGIGDVVFVLLELVLHELGIEAPVGNRLDHRIRDMTDPAQACGFQRQIRGGDIHPHTADHDGHQLLLTEVQTEIINSFHETPSRQT